MKRLALVSLIAAATAAAAAGAHAEAYVDNARVNSVEPRYETVNVPRQECQNRRVIDPQRSGGREYGREYGRDYGGRDYGGSIIGGVAGALLGNQVGKGHGKEAATAVGAVVGAFTGDRMANRDRWDDPYEQASREVTSCRTVNDVQQRLVGYHVNYDYRGQQFSTVMRDNPGQYLQVRVSVDPVGR